MKASPRTSFVTQRPSRTFTTNQPSVAGARPPSVSSSRASSTIRRLGRREPLGRSGASSLRLDLAVLRRRGRHELVEQPLGRCSDLVDRAGEGFRVRLRRLREAADLADVLERGVADLLVCGGWLEVVERMDVSAHAHILRICIYPRANVTLTVASIFWVPGSIGTLESLAPAARGIGIAPPPSTIAVTLPSVELDAAANVSAFVRASATASLRALR